MTRASEILGDRWTPLIVREPLAGLRHFNDLERVAIVGNRTWQKLMTGFCKPFTTAQVRFFEHPQLEEARAWVNPASG